MRPAQTVAFSLPTPLCTASSYASFPPRICADNRELYTSTRAHDGFAAEILLAQRQNGFNSYHPVVIPRCRIAERWASSGAWQLPGLMQRLQAPLTAKRSRGRSFMYAELGRPESLPDSDLDAHQTDLVTLEPKEFSSKILSQGTAEGDSHYYYYTTQVGALEGGQLLRSAPEWEQLVPEAGHGWGSMDPYLSVWIGGAGSTTQMHYDVQHNVFVQVYGTKRFWLHPPAEMTNLHVFPDAHPRARKSQINFDRVDAERFPFHRRLRTPWCATLHEGDALYIPAFWFHHVEAVTPCVSLNVFSESRLKMAAARALMIPPPIAPGRLEDGSTIALFLAALCDILPKIGVEPAVALDEVVISRFKPLMSLQGPQQADIPFQHTDSVERRHQDYTRHTQDLVEAFQAMDNEVEGEHGPGVKDIVVAHLLEMWALRTFGAHEVARCLAWCSSNVK
ncbi:hypothetical protein CYMTET_45383 [Cymbomonas tetramitiformis]|uniref:JmjC domain-containing protein n=1 Tax=Cymbomonas tetramitiformis TaxID=36881 RepID=A0AAE0C038_9CHLO|nr:hypothetical protein CYMTET_45383 [Cymbomonas tetramitiformis]